MHDEQKYCRGYVDFVSTTCVNMCQVKPLESFKRGLICPFCIMLLYRYLLHYGLLLHIMSQYLCLFSLILQGLHKEGECRQLGFWAGKGANIRDLFCAAPKVLKLHGRRFQNIYNILSGRSSLGGPHPAHKGGGRALPPGRAPYLVGPLVAL